MEPTREDFSAWMDSFRERSGDHSPFEVYNDTSVDGALRAEAYGAYFVGHKLAPAGGPGPEASNLGG